MDLNKNFLFKFLTILLILFSFFAGYILRENASGGGQEFYNLSWPIINSFKICTIAENFSFHLFNRI